MPEKTPVAEKIAELTRVVGNSEHAVAVERVTAALSDRSSHVIAKAAQLCSELQARAAIDELLTAYKRMFVNPLKKDPGCVAKTAIATALAELEHQEVEPFRRGVRYEQFEPVWGGQEDTAALLRAACAAGMVVSASLMEALTSFADLLADPCRPARIGAARAIQGLGHWEGVPLLRLKLLSGDDPEVLGECATALLGLDPEGGFPLIVGLLASPSEDVRVQAAFALGQSRHARAFQPLCDCWRSETVPTTRGLLLTCIGLLRSNESQQFLISQIDGPDQAAAADAIRALAPFAMLDEVREAVERAVEDTDSQQLQDVFEEEFRRLGD